MTLITGGARSGKSRHALALAEEVGHRRAYLATAEPLDEEMRRRIERHRAERGDGWATIEEPVDLAGAIGRLAPETEVAVIDCLTVWLGNLVHRANLTAGSAAAAAGDSESDAAITGSVAPAPAGAAVPDPPVESLGEETPAPASRHSAAGAADLADPRSFPEIASLLSSLDAPPCPLILVTNELGWGIVPDNALARAFRDLAGRVNEEAARRAERVVLMVAGRPLELAGGRGG